MDAVAQIEARVSGYTIQEKRIKYQPILFGKARIKTVKGFAIARPQIGCGQHAGQHHLKPARLQFFDDLAKVFFRHFGRQAAQHIIGAQLDNYRLRFASDGPVEPRQAAGAGIARHAAIMHAHAMAFGRQCSL